MNLAGKTLTAILLTLLITLTISGQSTTGTLTGRVTDPTR